MKKIHHIEIKPVSNGFQMEIHHTTGSQKEPSYYQDHEKEETIHPTHQHLVAHLSKKLAKHKLTSKITAKAMNVGNDSMKGIDQGFGDSDGSPKSRNYSKSDMSDGD